MWIDMISNLKSQYMILILIINAHIRIFDSNRFTWLLVRNRFRDCPQVAVIDPNEINQGPPWQNAIADCKPIATPMSANS
jgi:hypothetical protein